MESENLPTIQNAAQPATVGTESFASSLGVKAQTVRHSLCQKGHYMGVRPVKLPNRFLRWPADAAAKILADAENAA